MKHEKARLIVEMIYQSIVHCMEEKKTGAVYFRFDFSQGGIQACKRVEMSEKDIGGIA